MNVPAYRVTRQVEPIECPWLAHPIAKGSLVFRSNAPTYGAIGDGVAVTFNPSGGNPFFELPEGALTDAGDPV